MLFVTTRYLYVNNNLVETSESANHFVFTHYICWTSKWHTSTHFLSTTTTTTQAWGPQQQQLAEAITARDAGVRLYVYGIAPSKCRSMTDCEPVMSAPHDVQICTHTHIISVSPFHTTNRQSRVSAACIIGLISTIYIPYEIV